jgi:hypothetical protein
MIQKVKAINPTIKIYWLNMYNTQDSDKMKQFDAALTSLSTTQGFTVIDWSAVATPFYTAKQLHPTGDGYNTMAGIVSAALGKAPSS